MRRLLKRLAFILWLALAGEAFAGFVYETPSEFLTSADVNGDGALDVLVLDRATGNVRVGYQYDSGVLTWSSPIATGVANAAGFTTGRFLAGDRETIAVTAPGLNRVHVVNLTDTASAASPLTFAPIGVGPSMLIGLRAPQGTEEEYDALWTSSNVHDPGRTLIEVFAFLGEGIADLMHGVSEADLLERGNALRFGNSPRTYAAAISRGSNDTFLAQMVTNNIVVFLARSNLPPQTEYVFGRFNNEVYPRFLFYVPGESNIIVQSLTDASGSVAFGAATVNPFASPVERVFYVDEGSNGLAVIQFGNGLVGARLPAGSDTIQAEYSFGAGAGNTGVLTLGNGRFALLRGAGGSSETVKVYTRSGANYTDSGTSSLPRVTSTGTRANLWLFATEPFVNADPLFVSSLNAGDWITSVTGLPGSLTVIAEADRGTSEGLGDPTTETLSAPPSTVQFGIVNQYHPGISLFSYSNPRAPEPVLVRIAPPPGHYESAVNISFTTSNASDLVFYRVGSAGLFRQYLAPFALSSNAAMYFYGLIASSGQRSSIQTASYTFTDNSFPQLVTTNGTGTNNIPPGGTISTSGVPVYAYGTVVYSRRAGADGEIWMVNLDGTSDRYVTRGSRPRLSPDGRHLAFLREGDPFATIPYNNGNVWVRDLLTGNESRLITHTGLIFGFDWGYRTNLSFDHDCGLFVTDLNGNVTQVSAGTDCNDEAPVVNPIDGTLAFHNASGVGNANSGLFVTDATLSAKVRITGAPVPHWPSWAPDGQRLAFASYSYTYILESGMDLYIAHASGSDIHQITGFAHASGFRYGAAWAPAGDALVGAGTVLGTNGIWVIPLSADGTHCEGELWLIPITPGADPDFVGNVYVPPPPPQLFVRREGDDVIVSWRRTAWPYALQASGELGAAAWNTIPGPFQIAGQNYERRVLAGALQATQFYRLRLP